MTARSHEDVMVQAINYVRKECNGYHNSTVTIQQVDFVDGQVST